MLQHPQPLSVIRLLSATVLIEYLPSGFRGRRHIHDRLSSKGGLQGDTELLARITAGAGTVCATKARNFEVVSPSIGRSQGVDASDQRTFVQVRRPFELARLASYTA